MKKIQWFLVNGVFVAALWFGLVEGVAGAKNIAMFIAWGAIIIGFLATATEEGREIIGNQAFAMPVEVEGIFDVAVALFLVWHSVWVAGSLYLISQLLVIGARGRRQ